MSEPVHTQKASLNHTILRLILIQAGMTIRMIKLYHRTLLHSQGSNLFVYNYIKNIS